MAFLISLTTTGTLTHLNNISGGLNVNERVGLQAEMTKLDIDTVCSVSDATNIIRQIVFIWNEANPVDPLLTDILAFGTIVSNYNIVAPKKYTIIYDRYYMLDSNGPQQKHVKSTKRFSNTKKMQWSTLVGTDYVSNSLWVLHFSDSALPGDPTVDFYSRIHYTDS